MSSIIAVVGWYLSGFLIARHLVDHGHSPMMWWGIAALLGAATAVPALFAVLWRRAGSPQVEVIAQAPIDDGALHVLAVAPVDRLAASLEAIPPSVGGRADAVTLVGTVGFEAFSSGVDTGERARAAEIIGRRLRPCSTTDNRVITTVGVGRLEAVVAQVGVPDLVVSSPRPGKATTRLALRRCLELSAEHDIPVLMVPDATSLPTSAVPEPVVA